MLSDLNFSSWHLFFVSTCLKGYFSPDVFINVWLWWFSDTSLHVMKTCYFTWSSKNVTSPWSSGLRSFLLFDLPCHHLQIQNWILYYLDKIWPHCNSFWQCHRNFIAIQYLAFLLHLILSVATPMEVPSQAPLARIFLMYRELGCMPY